MDFIYWFVGRGWLYLMAFIGVFLTIWLFFHWRRYSWTNRLGTLALIVLCYHVFEEWVFPGGFHHIYNISSNYPDRYPMNQLTDMITNLGGEIIGMVVLFTFGLNNGSGLAIGVFSLFEVVIHTILAGQSLSYYSSLGQTAFYAPGLLTSWFMFFPLFIGYLLYFIYHKEKPKWFFYVGGFSCLIVLSLLLVQLPEALLKSESTPFIFPDEGYYEQFINGGHIASHLGGDAIGLIILVSFTCLSLLGTAIYYFFIKKKSFRDLSSYLKSLFN